MAHIVGRVVAAEPPSMRARLTRFGARLQAALYARCRSRAKIETSASPRLEALADDSTAKRASLGANTVLRPVPQIIVRDLQNELLLGLRGSDDIQVLNRSAREIYLLLDGRRSLQHIAAEIAARYAKSASELETDVGTVAASLYHQGLLVTDESVPVGERNQSTK